jgi:GGDEF domain-containing protein
VLAAHHWLTVYEPELSIDSLVLLAGGLAGYLVTALGVFLSTGYWNRQRAANANAAGHAGAAGQAAPGASENSHAVLGRAEMTRRMAESFLNWCEQELPETQVWNSFDQLVREMLTEQLGAVRVRCYQVLPGDQQYRSLSQPGTPGEALCARSGILGHVATTGREFVAADPAHGELVTQLAEEGSDPWEWVFAIREESQTVGLVAIGKLPPTVVLDRARRQDLATLITIFWKFVAGVERLHIAERTDKASGMLTRSDFLARATRALAESYAENEPAVVVVLALEGLRWLDDAGRWSDHDVLVESVGQLVKRRIRTDDIIGRFSEDRFVLLLRRLDSSLGRLIAAKTRDTVEGQIKQLSDIDGAVRVRVGLTGSGFRKPPLEELLVAAFDAAERARKQDLPLYCDLVDAKPPPPPPAAARRPAQEVRKERATS